MKISRILLSLTLIPLLFVGLFLATHPTQAAGPDEPFSPSARQALSELPANQRATFFITLQNQLAYQAGNDSPLRAAAKLTNKEARHAAVAGAMQAYARQQQAGLLAQARNLQAQGQVGRLVSLWIVNGISLEATPAAIRALAARPEVARVDLDPDPSRRIVPLGDALDSLSAASSSASAATAQPEPNVSLVNAPALWSLGYTGQGVVVANLDTGVDASHPDLAPTYRGGSNSWYDPYLNITQPYDNAGGYTGHGTMTMGLMVGGSNGGTDIGMAPGATWIAAKIFDNSGNASNANIHLSFQWVITAGADVVNNSWGEQSTHTCDTTFQPDINALLAAGILPVFSAGNYGPNLQTDVSPANLPGAFSVGAVDNSDVIASFSSRGPGACSSSQPFPYVVAPGVALKTTWPGGLYNACNGTSCAAPEVSGALALLLSADPTLAVTLQQQALVQGAHPLTPAVPDPAYGYGQVDVFSAYNWVGLKVLNAPGNMQAAAVSPSQIDLTWADTNTNETGYEVMRSPNGEYEWVKIATTAADATSYSDTSGLAEGTTYYYLIRAVNTSLGYTSDFAAASATTLLLAPTNFTATAVSSSQVDLSWVNNSQFAGGTVVQRSPNGTSGWTTLGTAPAGATTFSDSSGLVEGTPYYYRVQTVNAAHTLASLYADASAVTPLLAPSGLEAAPISNATVYLFWTDHSLLATGYEVQRSPDGLNGWQTLTSALPGTATSYTDDGSVLPLMPGTLTFYRVRATGPVPGSDSPFTPPARAVVGPYWIYFAVMIK